MSLPAHDFHILLSIYEEPRHGYAIIQDVAARTDGDTRLGTSTLYAALKRLAQRGLIDHVTRPAGAESDDERRRYFRASPRGRALARDEARRIERLHALATDARLIPASRSGGRKG